MPSDEARAAFPRILSYYMYRENLSQADIAAKLNVSKQIVSDWVKGKKFPRVDRMQRLAELFGVLLSDMYSYDRFPAGGSAMLEASSLSVLSPEEQRLVICWRAADEDIRKSVRKLLDFSDDLKKHRVVGNIIFL